MTQRHALLLLLFLTAITCACLPTSAAADRLDYSSIWDQIAKGAQVIDVRTADEFKVGHLPMARNIDYEEIGQQLSALGADRSKTIILYCASGTRAGKAQRTLREHGFTDVINAEGYEELLAAQPQNKTRRAP